MGLFDRFTKSFEDTVNQAINTINGMNLGVRSLGAEVEGKFVTLTGDAPSMAVKKRVMEEFNRMVKTDNTLNSIRIVEPEAPKPPPAEPPKETIYEVVAGDTLSGIAKRFYGNAGQYMKIFEANRDILDNPDLIKIGQKLRIPDA